MISSLVTVYLSPVWVLAQCCLVTLAFNILVTIPASTLSWLSITWHWPTKIYICPSLSLMLPFNIGLPKTPHGLSLDRCHEPCPSVIPNTDQPRLQLRPLSLDLMLPQHQPDQDYCFLVSVMRVKLRQLHQMAHSTNPSSGGHVIQWHYLWVIPKITGGFRVIAPFTPPFLKYNFWYFYWDNWTRIFLVVLNLGKRSEMTCPQNYFYNTYINTGLKEYCQYLSIYIYDKSICYVKVYHIVVLWKWFMYNFH